jgi:hypothetical protein
MLNSWAARYKAALLFFAVIVLYLFCLLIGYEKKVISGLSIVLNLYAVR